MPSGGEIRSKYPTAVAELAHLVLCYVSETTEHLIFIMKHEGCALIIPVYNFIVIIGQKHPEFC